MRFDVPVIGVPRSMQCGRPARRRCRSMPARRSCSMERRSWRPRRRGNRHRRRSLVLSASPFASPSIGVGQLGRHHARLLAGLPDVELVGVFDLNRQRAEEIAATVKTSVLTDLAALPSQVDAVTIAVPTGRTRRWRSRCSSAACGAGREAARAFGRGGRRADRAAARGGATLAVGHTERFNPAVQAARPLLHHPRFIEVHRLGTFLGAQSRHRCRLRPDDS